MVVKRDGTKQALDVSKISKRIRELSDGLSVESERIAKKTIDDMCENITTTELDNVAAEAAMASKGRHPDYETLAARIEVSNLHKSTPKTFSECVRLLGESGENILDPEFVRLVLDNAERLDAEVDHRADYGYSFFGMRTLEKSYLKRMRVRARGETIPRKVIVERPQYMWMRVALGIHGRDLDLAIESYRMMSRRLFTHATPTLHHAGCRQGGLASCYLIAMKDDSIEGIYDTAKQCAMISKSAGGIGLHVSNIRASGTHIEGTGGESNGLVPMLRVFASTAKYVDQGGNKRPGAFAIYIEPWHADFLDALKMRDPKTNEEKRALNLHFAVWMPDLFMRRVTEGKNWTFFCPKEAPRLNETHNDEFERLYLEYEFKGLGRQTVPAAEVWAEIVRLQIKTGEPYIVYKDAVNRKSNQSNLGTIKSSNLCTEIMEFSSPDETAVCNLASVSLAAFVVSDADPSPVVSDADPSPVVSDAAGSTGKQRYDYAALHATVKTMTVNLNRVIDVSDYPTPEARRSNLRHRPIGLGVQGLADVFIKIRVPFDSEEAASVNRSIFETIYHAALEASCELAARDGPYDTYEGSPASRGVLQQDMWEAEEGAAPTRYSGMWEWGTLRAMIKNHGLRNSLLVAPMPTATTSQILGNTESVEPLASNYYVRRTLAGEFSIVNAHLVRDLQRMGLWDETVRQRIIADRGSVQNIAEIPPDIRALYKTVWEMKMRALIDMTADRGRFIDQGQSTNLFLSDPTVSQVSSMHIYAWKRKLKTGIYYLRSRPATTALNFSSSGVAPAASATVEPSSSEACEMCSA